jgi:hypothetical protein
MSATLSPTRLDVTDRFPMLAFNIRTDGSPQRAEVVVATEPTLFAEKAKRTLSNFYSSRAHGPLAIPRGEAVYMVPPACSPASSARSGSTLGWRPRRPTTARGWRLGSARRTPAPMFR